MHFSSYVFDFFLISLVSFQFSQPSLEFLLSLLSFLWPTNDIVYSRHFLVPFFYDLSSKYHKHFQDFFLRSDSFLILLTNSLSQFLKNFFIFLFIIICFFLTLKLFLILTLLFLFFNLVLLCCFLITIIWLFINLISLVADYFLLILIFSPWKLLFLCYMIILFDILSRAHQLFHWSLWPEYYFWANLLWNIVFHFLSQVLIHFPPKFVNFLLNYFVFNLFFHHLLFFTLVNLKNVYIFICIILFIRFHCLIIFQAFEFLFATLLSPLCYLIQFIKALIMCLKAHQKLASFILPLINFLTVKSIFWILILNTFKYTILSMFPIILFILRGFFEFPTIIFRILLYYF